MNIQFFAVFIILIFALTPGTIRAEDQQIPIPARKVNIEDIQSKINKEKENQSELSTQLRQAEQQLGETSEKLVTLARNIQGKEQALHDLENRMNTLSVERAQIRNRLEKDYGSISNLILALQRLERIPAEALIVRPGAPLQTAQSAMLLQSILPVVKSRAKTLSKDLARLGEIELALYDDKIIIAGAISELESKRTELESLLSKRKKIYSNTKSSLTISESRLKKLSAEARNIQQLIEKLDKEQKSNARMAGASPKPLNKPFLTRQPGSMPRAGSAHIPVSGEIKVFYGAKDDIGAISRGITIESRKNALVSAPMGGIVRFAGYFKNLGEIIIIEHENNYHSLIAGLGKIDTVVGQSVDAGEPIGSMPALNNKLPRLYYELRYKGKPTNPSTKFSELS
jgi:septal ring factor EnvC (AmiA/AmiB activator)